MTARAEDSYYAEQVTLPRLRPRPLGMIVTIVGLVLVFGTSLI